MALRAHWPVAVVVALSALVRGAAEIAYRPALFYSDSWVYVAMAYGPRHFDPTRPSGYGFALLVLGKLTHSLAAISTLQHVAGLALTVLVYAVALQLRLGRWPATVLAALVGLDAWLIALEQTVMAEALFALLLTGALALLIADPGGRRWIVAVSGVTLAAACMVRTAGLFAVPFWFTYIAWRRRNLVVAGVAVAALALPLFAYAALYRHSEGVFGMSAAGGWFSYGRVARMADCSRFDPPAGTRPLCETAAERAAHRPVYYLWNPASPARRRYGDVSADRAENDVLRRFARAALRADPVGYTGMVTSDFASYFIPGRSSPAASDQAITFPERPRTEPPFMNTELRDRYEPGYRPEVHAPAGALRSYAQVFHAPRWLLGLAALVALAELAVVAATRGRARVDRAPEVLLFAGSGLALLLGATATSAFVLRYVVPVAPLLLIGGATAVADLLVLGGVRPRRSLRYDADTLRGSPPRPRASAVRVT